jgi:hypothetical protein
MHVMVFADACHAYMGFSRVGDVEVTLDDQADASLR